MNPKTLYKRICGAFEERFGADYQKAEAQFFNRLVHDVIFPEVEEVRTAALESPELRKSQQMTQDKDAMALESVLIRQISAARGFAANPPRGLYVLISTEELRRAYEETFGPCPSTVWSGRRIHDLMKSNSFQWLRPAARSSSGNRYSLSVDAFTGSKK